MTGTTLCHRMMASCIKTSGIWEIVDRTNNKKSLVLRWILNGFKGEHSNVLLYFDCEYSYIDDYSGIDSEVVLVRENDFSKIVWISEIMIKNGIEPIIIVDSLPAVTNRKNQELSRNLSRLNALSRQKRCWIFIINYEYKKDIPYYSSFISSMIDVSITITEKEKRILIRTEKNNTSYRFPEICILDNGHTLIKRNLWKTRFQ